MPGQTSADTYETARTRDSQLRRPFAEVTQIAVGHVTPFVPFGA